jgi:uncharacterized membrane protein YgaE (UPF0421/DUF939 family)
MTSKPNYTGLGIALGAALGVVAGVLAGNVGVWIAIGVAIGIVIGASFRRKPVECPECAEVHRIHLHKMNQKRLKADG